jgi:hypothetical protein
MKPSALGLCDPKDDPAVMLAYMNTKQTMEAYEVYLQERETEKANRRTKR